MLHLLFTQLKPSCCLFSFCDESKCSFLSTLKPEEILWKHPDTTKPRCKNAQKNVARSGLWRPTPTKCHLVETGILSLSTGCWWAEVPPRMLHLHELWNVHWRWGHLHTSGTHQTLLVSVKPTGVKKKCQKQSLFLVKQISNSGAYPVFYLSICAFYSGHCFSEGVVSSVRSASPLTKSPHMVALVSFPPRAGGRRGLTVATEPNQEKGPGVTITGSVWTLVL